jgi:hypothetical protein
VRGVGSSNLPVPTNPSSEFLNCPTQAKQRLEWAIGGKDLNGEYEVRRTPQQDNDNVSPYLQHCTEQRVENRNRKVREVLEELCPLIDKFDVLLPSEKVRRWKSAEVSWFYAPTRRSRNATYTYTPIANSQTSSKSAAPFAYAGCISLHPHSGKQVSNFC